MVCPSGGMCTGNIIPMHVARSPALFLFATQLTHLAPVDLAILLLYFAMVIFVGFYEGIDQHQRAVLSGRTRDVGVDRRGCSTG